MTPLTISLTVNGEAREVQTEPREHLADLLRGKLMLTGTHIGCEHGVCGACTVEIDGVPARSCITHAGSCDGARVRTIEGFGDDEVMAALREAFTREHALQLLYARHARGQPRHRPEATRGRRGAGPRGTGRQSLPLHRLSRHRPRRAERADCAAGTAPAAVGLQGPAHTKDAAFSGSPPAYFA